MSSFFPEHLSPETVNLPGIMGNRSSYVRTLIAHGVLASEIDMPSDQFDIMGALVAAGLEHYQMEPDLFPPLKRGGTYNFHGSVLTMTGASWNIHKFASGVFNPDAEPVLVVEAAQLTADAYLTHHRIRLAAPILALPKYARLRADLSRR